MNVFTVTTDAQFQEIKNGWSNLFKKNRLHTLFQSWYLNYEWWNLNKDLGNLHIICFGSKENILIILPTYITRQNKLIFLQDGSSDFLDIIYDESLREADLFAHLNKIRNYILETSEIDSLAFNHLRKESPVVDLLPAAFRKEKFFLLQTDMHTFFYREDFETDRFVKTLKSKQYVKLKKIDERLQTDFSVLENSNHPFPETVIQSLLSEMQNHGIRDTESYKKQLSFMKSLYETDKIFFMAQRLEDRYISMTCILHLTSDRWMGWIDFYDPSIKTVNLKNYIHILRHCKKRRVAFDMGTGLYEYKIQNFFPHFGTLYSFYFYKKRARFIYYFIRKTIARALGII